MSMLSQDTARRLAILLSVPLGFHEVKRTDLPLVAAEELEASRRLWPTGHHFRCDAIGGLEFLHTECGRFWKRNTP